MCFRYVVALLFCWLPDRVNILLTMTKSVLIKEAVACRMWHMICKLLVTLNNCINPLVYFIFTKKKRRKNASKFGTRASMLTRASNFWTSVRTQKSPIL